MESDIYIYIYIERGPWQESESFVYHRLQNKCYPQRCLFAHFEATLDFGRIEFICPY